MRHVVIGTIALALGLGLTGCDDEASTSPEKGVASASASAKEQKPVVAEPELPADAPKVELLSAGSDPKKELRYAFQKGQSQQWVMKHLMKMSIEGAKRPPGNMPEIAFTFEVEAAKVEPNGVGHLRFSYSKAEIGESGLPARIRTEMTKGLKEISKVKGTQVVTDRGFILQSDLDVSGVTDERLQVLLDSMRQSIKQMANPLPKEAVGVGAKWKVIHDVDTMGMELTQTANYEVVSMDGSNVELKVTVEQKAEDTELAMPGMPDSAKVEVKEVDSNGKGTMTIDLESLLPTSNLRFETKVVTRKAKGPEVSMNMDLTLSITPAD